MPFSVAVCLRNWRCWRRCRMQEFRCSVKTSDGIPLNAGYQQPSYSGFGGADRPTRWTVTVEHDVVVGTGSACHEGFSPLNSSSDNLKPEQHGCHGAGNAGRVQRSDDPTVNRNRSLQGLWQQTSTFSQTQPAAPLLPRHTTY